MSTQCLAADKSLVTTAFRQYGQYCGNNPWQIIFVTATLVLALATSDTSGGHEVFSSEYDMTHASVMVVIKCVAMIMTYHQLRQLQRQNNSVLIALTVLFLLLCCSLFSVCVMKVLNCPSHDLKDAIFFPLFVLDVSKLRCLSSYPFASQSSLSLAQSMAIFGPGLALDTCVEVLLFGVGTLGGVPLVSRVIQFVTVAIITNYISLMTFYPACVSLVLQMRKKDCPNSDNNISQPSFTSFSTSDSRRVSTPTGDDCSHNPVRQRLKVIMSAGLMLVHCISRFSIVSLPTENSAMLRTNVSLSAQGNGFVIRYLNLGTDQCVYVCLLCLLLWKYWMVGGWSEEGEKTVFCPSLTTAKNPATESTPQTMTSTDFTAVGTIGAAAGGTIGAAAGGTIVAPPTEAPVTPTHVSDEGESRTTEECLAICAQSEEGITSLNDAELVDLVSKKLIRGFKLESLLRDHERGVRVRRKMVESKGLTAGTLSHLPYQHYDYSKVSGVCCENVIGYMPIPVGVAGPLTINGRTFFIPMATTEGCLVASTNRGCQALQKAKRLDCRIFKDGMTRAPVVTFCSMTRADEVRVWVEKEETQKLLKEAFDSTSNFAKFKRVSPETCGNNMHLRFEATTGDAMGMNMVSKGAEAALKVITEYHPDMKVVSISGNMCTDKKPSALNWIVGRGKSVCCEALIPANVVKTTLKTTVEALVHTNISKNMEGSAMAGSVGGFNAHAANIVAAVFIACGQDPAQVVGSSNCLTKMESRDGDLLMSVTMKSLEVGTVGGGTSLPPQGAALNMLGVRGAHPSFPGTNSRQLAMVIAGAVLAGELSVLAALTAGHLVNSHLKMNRRLKEAEKINESKEGASHQIDESTPRLKEQTSVDDWLSSTVLPAACNDPTTSSI